MNFTIKENSANGTIVGVLPAEFALSLLDADKNHDNIPAFSISSDNVIRVADSKELDFEKLFAGRSYQVLVAQNGPDDIINITVEDDPDEKFLGTPGDDSLRSGWGKATLSGFGGNDQLIGTFEEDTLAGGAGSDVLTGGSGSDTFVFDAPLRSGVDVVTDFVNAGREADKISLDKTTFTKLKKNFSFEQVRGGQAARLSDALIVYNARSGALIYNANQDDPGFGRGGGKFAQISRGLTLTAKDFLVQA